MPLQIRTGTAACSPELSRQEGRRQGGREGAGGGKGGKGGLVVAREAGERESFLLLGK